MVPVVKGIKVVGSLTQPIRAALYSSNPSNVSKHPRRIPTPPTYPDALNAPLKRL